MLDNIEQVALEFGELYALDQDCILEVAVFIETEVCLVDKSALLIVFRCKRDTSPKKAIQC